VTKFHSSLVPSRAGALLKQHYLPLLSVRGVALVASAPNRDKA